MRSPSASSSTASRNAFTTRAKTFGPSATQFGAVLSRSNRIKSPTPSLTRRSRGSSSQRSIRPSPPIRSRRSQRRRISTPARWSRRWRSTIRRRGRERSSPASSTIAQPPGSRRPRATGRFRSTRRRTIAIPRDQASRSPTLASASTNALACCITTVRLLRTSMRPANAWRETFSDVVTSQASASRSEVSSAASPGKRRSAVHELDLTREIDRQLSVGNACRYCEGYCAVFPAAEMLTSFNDGAVTYLANLCHDCRNCYDACMFSPPHEFAVNIPKVLAEARVRTYERYSWPNVFARLLRSGWIAPVASGVLVLGAIAVLGGPANLVTRHVGPGAFYGVVPYLALLIPALAISLWGLFVILAGAREFARDVALARGPSLNWAAFAKATAHALSFQYLKGGGE